MPQGRNKTGCSEKKCWIMMGNSTSALECVEGLKGVYEFRVGKDCPKNGFDRIRNVVLFQGYNCL
jgi:hypothetical protein